MLVFFFGMGVVGAAGGADAERRGSWPAALTLIGTFASIYHPVGIPMLVQQRATPGATIGVNGLSGNLGIAVAALVTGLLVKWLGWRAAFAVPGLVCHRRWACCSLRLVPPETRSAGQAQARRRRCR